MSCVFGPVPSRRLGRSLGVDVVPFKTCTYDCIYCQLGRTTDCTVARQAWTPVADVLADVEARLPSRPDYITLSGSGEPTLYAQTRELIDGIKQRTDVPVAVLTNGSLLWRGEVRSDLMRADLVIPSLDAGDGPMFRAVNRPHAEITFEKMLEGLIRFRKEFAGEYWLEALLLGGYTAVESEIAKLAECVDRIRPDRLQINTVSRPPAEEFAVGVGPERLAELAGLFKQHAEVIADFSDVHKHADFAAGRQEILDLLGRRPCSVDDVAEGLGMHRNEVVKYLEELTAEKLLTGDRLGGKTYYRAAGR